MTTTPMTDWILTARPGSMGQFPDSVHETSDAVVAALRASAVLTAVIGDDDEIRRAELAAAEFQSKGSVTQLSAEISGAAWRLIAERLKAGSRALGMTGVTQESALTSRAAQQAWSLAMVMESVANPRRTDAQRSAVMRGA